MRLLIVLLVSLSFSAYAENWVFTKDKKEVYDKDSITRVGDFSEITVRGVGPFEMDCVNRRGMNRRSIQTVQNGWFDINPSEPSEVEIFNAACSKWWEFWKR